MKLKIFLVIAIVLLIMPSAYAEPDSTITINLNGRSLSLAQAPYADNGTVMIPLRGVFEQLGIKVDWNSGLKKISLKSKDKTIELGINEKKAIVNGEEIGLDHPPEVRSHTTYIPLRFAITHSGYQVRWDSAAKTVYIASATEQQAVGVSGKVLGSKGEAIGGASVQIEPNVIDGRRYSVISAADGSYSVTGLTPGVTYRAIAFPPEGSSDASSAELSFKAEDRTEELPNLKLLETQLSAQVIDESGTIEGRYRVTFMEAKKDNLWTTVSEAYTDKDNRFRIGGMAEGREYALLVRHEGSPAVDLDVLSGTDRFIYWRETILPDIYVNVPPYLKLYDPEGREISPLNVQLTVVGDKRGYLADPNEKGQYVVKGIRPGSTFNVIVAVNGESSYKAPEPITVTYKKGQTLLGEVRLLDAGAPSATGWVRDDVGEAVSNFSVTLTDMITKKTYTRQWDGEEGKFLLYELQPGHRYQLVVNPLVEYNRDPKYVNVAPYEFTFEDSRTEPPAIVLPRVQMKGKASLPKLDGASYGLLGQLYDTEGHLISRVESGASGSYFVGGMVEGQTYRLELNAYRLLTKEELNNHKPPFGTNKKHTQTFVYDKSVTEFAPIAFDS